LHREKFPRKTVLLKKGQVCRKLWFVERGFARAYYFKEDKEVTAWFMGDGDFIISVYCVFQQKPSYEVIELLEDASLISISYDDLQRMYSNYSEFSAVWRILTEKYYERRTAVPPADTHCPGTPSVVAASAPDGFSTGFAEADRIVPGHYARNAESAAGHAVNDVLDIRQVFFLFPLRLLSRSTLHSYFGIG